MTATHKPRWQDHHLLAPEDVEEHVRRLDRVRRAHTVVIPVFGEVGSILHEAEDGLSSICLGSLDRPDWVYVHTTYTHPSVRGQGRMRQMMDELYEWANHWRFTLVTHPADPWLEDRLVRNGWSVVQGPDALRYTWHREDGEDVFLYERTPR